mmetsp:Transcript_40483/g.84884  ORF Transcript_40483/g.84884 Transcript_40483/m.84884 type:complete len:226 (-) Transcript_40483:431-1108(-)
MSASCSDSRSLQWSPAPASACSWSAAAATFLGAFDRSCCSSRFRPSVSRVHLVLRAALQSLARACSRCMQPQWPAPTEHVTREGRTALATKLTDIRCSMRAKLTAYRVRRAYTAHTARTHVKALSTRAVRITRTRTSSTPPTHARATSLLHRAAMAWPCKTAAALLRSRRLLCRPWLRLQRCAPMRSMAMQAAMLHYVMDTARKCTWVPSRIDMQTHPQHRAGEG